MQTLFNDPHYVGELVGDFPMAKITKDPEVIGSGHRAWVFNKLAHRVIEWVNGGHFRHARKDPGRQGSLKTLLVVGMGHDPGSRYAVREV